MISGLFSLVGLIPGLFNTVNNVTNAIANERLKLISAKTEEEKILSQERINSLQAKRDLMIAESNGSKINSIVRSLLAIGPTIVLTKIYVYDKALGQWTNGHTDALDPNLWNVIMATIGFYFLYEMGTKVARIVKS